MKRLFLLLAFVLAGVFYSCEEYDDSAILDRLSGVEARVKQLEEMCKQMNTNISSLQTIVSAIQKNDQISSIAPITKNGEEIGYTIVFTSGKIITIYHGADGQAPIVGVKKHTDGIYYWTINGEWMTDENGNRIRANAIDGEGGADGITPQLKVENGFWYISYDNGVTWEQLGKATGEDGDSFFQSVTQDDENVYFTLADGTAITIPKACATKDIKVSYIPRYSDGKATVYYSTKEDSYVEFDFEVSPASAAADWSEFATIKTVYTQTRAAVDFVEMEILEWSVVPDNGTITIKASGANLSDSFFAGTQEASARLVVEGNNVNIISAYIPLIAKFINLSPDNEIWYTSTEYKIVEPYKTDGFGATIVSNTYENGKGIIKFNQAVTRIGEYAFATCAEFTSVTIPNSVTSIETSAFSGCLNLREIVIPNSVANIGDSAFGDCVSLTTFISDLASTDGRCLILNGELRAFACNEISTYTMPNGVTSIGAYAFAGSNLTSITISNSVANIGDSAFAACTSLKSISIPNSVTSIEDYAFCQCTSLKSISIPNSVTSIGTSAFWGCTSLNDVRCKPVDPPAGGEKMFKDISSYAKIYVPIGSGDAYKGAPYWSAYSSIIGERSM